MLGRRIRMPLFSVPAAFLPLYFREGVREGWMPVPFTKVYKADSIVGYYFGMVILLIFCQVWGLETVWTH